MDSIGDYLKKMESSNETRATYRKIIQDVLKNREVIDFINKNKEELSEEAIERSAANLYEFVVEKEKADRGEGQLLSGYYPKLILNNKKIEVSYIPTNEQIQKRAQKELKNRIRSIHMPKNIKEATFDQFELTHGREEALDRSLQFVENYIQEPDRFQKGLYLHGAFGVGKTYLLGAIAHELSTFGYPSTLVHYPTFATEMRSSVGDQTTGSKLEAYKNAPILMLDDIGAEYPTSWIRDDVLGVILQYRMQNELATFFSSNFNMKELENDHLRYNQNGDDELLKAKRILERVRFLTDEIGMTGTNRRNTN
ncbi:MAG: primosomal protein DnaI [Atopostipes suicloacalis]|nr:primosomal protein DnaI [Atopostipes suicloacalis]